MAKYLYSEDEVKKAMKITSFRNLSKDKVMEFVSLIPRVDKEVAIAIIDQFPVYTEYALNMMSQLNEMCDKVLKSADTSQIATIEAYKKILDDLGEILKRGDITPEERKQITDQMIVIADRISVINAEHKKFLEKIYGYSAAAISGALLLGAAILGVNIKSRQMPSLEDDSEEDDSNSDVIEV